MRRSREPLSTGRAVVLAALLGPALAAAEPSADGGDWDWDAVEPEPAGAVTDTGSGGDGWDWGGFEAADEGPAARARREAAQADAPAVAVVEEVGAEPDLEAEPTRAYALFGAMADFRVVPARRNPDLHPCASCHEWVQSDPTPRELESPHDVFTLRHGLHGKGEFWCFTCHDLESGELRTLEGAPLDFEESYVLCSQCHVDQGRDWAFGAHGKRVDNWAGERVIYTCTACHYQHAPAPEPREALAGPVVRQGLARPEHWMPRQEDVAEVEETPPWQRQAANEPQPRTEATP